MVSFLLHTAVSIYRMSRSRGAVEKVVLTETENKTCVR